MSRRFVIDCDRCGAKAVESPIQIAAVVGWLTCPAGGSGEDDTERVDLCPKCAGGLLQSAVRGLQHEEARQWIAEARKKVKG